MIKELLIAVALGHPIPHGFDGLPTVATISAWGKSSWVDLIFCKGFKPLEITDAAVIANFAAENIFPKDANVRLPNVIGSTTLATAMKPDKTNPASAYATIGRNGSKIVWNRIKCIYTVHGVGDPFPIHQLKRHIGFNCGAVATIRNYPIKLNADTFPSSTGLPSKIRFDLSLTNSSGFSSHSLSGYKGQVNISDTNNGGKNSAKPNYPRGPQHTLGPLRHLPLGVQVLLGALGLAVCCFGVVYALSRTVEVGRGIEAFVILYLCIITLGVVSGMLLVGALVAI